MTTDEIKEKIVEAAKSVDMDTIAKLSAELQGVLHRGVRRPLRLPPAGGARMRWVTFHDSIIG